MKIYTQLKDIRDIDNTVIALGNFDGMHVGHMKLITRTVESAKISGVKSAVFTFANHPKNTLAGKTVIKNIISNEEKQRLIEEAGVDYLFSIPFTETVHHMSPDEFIKALLLDTFKACEINCGFNYHFGYKAEGGTETLIEAASLEGFRINVLEPVIFDGELVSSTLIRELISEGKVDESAKYLGRPYSTKGEVVVGNKIGRTIGFPTSNILIDETMVVPSHGVYVTNCIYDGNVLPGVTNVGIRPTIGDEKKTVETHMFDFNLELYGKDIRVEFLKKIRDERKFDNVEALSEQIAHDCETARRYHSLFGPKR